MSGRTPGVSILLPVRDAATTLGPALTSVLRQRFADWECLVVDDGSRDETRSIAFALERTDPRLRVLPGPPAGLVCALHRGLRAARGALVARMDGDDVMHPDRLALQVEALERHPEWAGVGTHVRLFPRPSLTPGRLAYEAWLNAMRSPEDIHRERFVECSLAHPTWTVRRRVLERFPYREGPWPEDYDVLLRVLGAGERLGIVPRALLGWRDHPGRLSRTDPRYRLERFTALKARHLALGPLARHRSYVLWGHGPTGRALRRALAEQGREPALIVEVHPRRIGRRIRGVDVVSPMSLPPRPELPVVAAVAGREARNRIRARLARLGYEEGRDWVAAA